MIYNQQVIYIIAATEINSVKSFKHIVGFKNKPVVEQNSVNGTK